MSKYNFMKLKHLEENPKIKNLLVQKSDPLQKLSETNMTLAEFKILDVYLGRIDSRNPESREVVFTKGELERLLEVKQIRKEELEKRLDNLFQTIRIDDKENSQDFIVLSLFEKSKAEVALNGQWTVKLKCTPSAMKYIFNIENIGYIRYRLHNVLHLKSRYSYFMFLYLEHNRFRKSWTVNVLELRKILNCMDKNYDKYYRFNEKVLKKAQRELRSKANVAFEYTGIKQGRAVKSIKFKITKLPKELEELKDCEKNQSELTISENKDYTDGIIENEIEEIDEKHIEMKPSPKKRKSLADLKSKYEKAMKEDPFFTEIKEQFGYGKLIQENPEYIDVLDFIFQTLSNTLGTESDTIKIKGEEKSVDVVIPRLLKLKPEEILYVAKKYSELKEVKNPEAFITTMLYGTVGRPVPKIKKTSYNLNDLLSKSELYIE